MSNKNQLMAGRVFWFLNDKKHFFLTDQIPKEALLTMAKKTRMASKTIFRLKMTL
jgi:hypothetical protein